MKKILIALFLLSNNLTAQGISFETEWKTAVAKATKEKKLIFIHAHNAWYHTSRYYEKGVFPDSAVGLFYNTNFINLICNTEKDWGIKAAKHYQIIGSPTFLFIHPESLEVYYRITHHNFNPKDFLEQGITANRERNAPPLSIMTSDYDAGKRDMGFLKALMQRKANQNLDCTKEFFEFIRIFSIDDLVKDYRIGFGEVKVKYGSPEYLRLKRMKKPNTHASDAIGYILMASVNAIMDTAVKRKDAALMERMLSEMRVLELSDKKLDNIRIDFFHKIGDSIQAFNYTEIYMTQYMLAETVKSIRQQDSVSYQNSMQYYLTGKKDSLEDKTEFEFQKMINTNQHARLIQSQIEQLMMPLVLKVKNKESLKKMLFWSNYALELEPISSISIQNQAILLYKNGETQKAIPLFSKEIDRLNKTKIENDNNKMADRLMAMKEQLEKMKKGTL